MTHAPHPRHPRARSAQQNALYHEGHKGHAMGTKAYQRLHRLRVLSCILPALCGEPRLSHRFAVSLCIMLSLGIGTARGEVGQPPAMSRDAANATLPAARNNLGLVPGAASGIMPSSIAIAGSPTGYAVGEVVTLTCAGCTFTTNPVVVVSTVSGGVPTAMQLRVPGVITTAPSASLTFTQSSSTGTGTGLTVTGSLGVIAADISVASLNTAGAGNGNMILGAETPLSTLYGAENTFIGDRAGGHFDTSSTGNTALGHNACGIVGAGTVVGSFNSCLSGSAGRNLAGTASNNLLAGYNAGRVVASNANTILGSNSAPALSSGGNTTILGYNNAPNLATGSGNIIIGANLAPTNLTGGGENILIAAGNNGADVDTPAINTTNMLNVHRTIAGTITNHAANNNPSLCAVGMPCVLGVLRSANFNITTDQSIAIRPLTSNNVGFIAGATKYIVTDIYVMNCSASLTAAKGGFYTAAGKTGTIIGATTTAFTNCTGATTMQRLSALANEDSNTFTAASLILSLTTAQGGAATGDVYIMGYPIN